MRGGRLVGVMALFLGVSAGLVGCSEDPPKAAVGTTGKNAAPAANKGETSGAATQSESTPAPTPAGAPDDTLPPTPPPDKS